MNSWLESKKKAESGNSENELKYSKSLEEWELKNKEIELAFSESVMLWEREKSNYEQKQRSNNSKIQAQTEAYFNKEAGFDKSQFFLLFFTSYRHFSFALI